MTIFNDIEIGMKFTIGNELYEKIDPVRVNCCKQFTAKKISNNERVDIKPPTEIELIIPEE